MKYLSVCVLILLATTSAFAASTFQNTCSQIMFVYNAAGQPVLQATCLTAAGTPHASSLVLTGISNQNGRLTAGSGASTFQQSCGNIQISVASSSAVNVTALCRASNGSISPSSVPINVNNNNGNLSY